MASNNGSLPIDVCLPFCLFPVMLHLASHEVDAKSLASLNVSSANELL